MTSKIRPVSLLSVVYKRFAKVGVSRTGDKLDFQQHKEQAGFRKSYSTMDHLYVVNQVIENSAKYTKPLYMALM